MISINSFLLIFVCTIVSSSQESFNQTAESGSDSVLSSPESVNTTDTKGLDKDKNETANLNSTQGKDTLTNSTLNTPGTLAETEKVSDISKDIGLRSSTNKQKIKRFRKMNKNSPNKLKDESPNGNTSSVNIGAFNKQRSENINNSTENTGDYSKSGNAIGRFNEDPFSDVTDSEKQVIERLKGILPFPKQGVKTDPNRKNRVETPSDIQTNKTKTKTKKGKEPAKKPDVSKNKSDETSQKEKPLSSNGKQDKPSLREGPNRKPRKRINKKNKKGSKLKQSNKKTELKPDPEKMAHVKRIAAESADEFENKMRMKGGGYGDDWWSDRPMNEGYEWRGGASQRQERDLIRASRIWRGRKNSFENNVKFVYLPGYGKTLLNVYPSQRFPGASPELDIIRVPPYEERPREIDDKPLELEIDRTEREYVPAFEDNWVNRRVSPLQQSQYIRPDYDRPWQDLGEEYYPQIDQQWDWGSYGDSNLKRWQKSRAKKRNKDFFDGWKYQRPSQVTSWTPNYEQGWTWNEQRDGSKIQDDKWRSYEDVNDQPFKGYQNYDQYGSGFSRDGYLNGPNYWPAPMFPGRDDIKT